MKAWDDVVVGYVGNDNFRLMGNSYMEDGVFGNVRFGSFRTEQSNLT